MTGLKNYAQDRACATKNIYALSGFEEFRIRRSLCSI